jgi:hypothetical protein
MNSHKTSEQLTGLSSNEHKFLRELYSLRGYYLRTQDEIEENIEKIKKMSDTMKQRIENLDDKNPIKIQYLNSDKNKIAINRLDLRILARGAYSQAMRISGKLGCSLNRTQLYERMDNLLGIGCLEQNPDSHITVNNNILPDNNTRYYIKIEIIESYIKTLEDKVHKFNLGKTSHPHPKFNLMNYINNNSNTNEPSGSIADESQHIN